MSDLKTWLLATRPKTLTAAFVPVGVGTALAFSHGEARYDAAAAALFVALFMQVGTNLANDYFDFQSGADTSARLGPTRVSQAGLIPSRQVFIGAALAFFATFLCGLYLVMQTGWPLLAVGVLSIMSGYAYTGGPFPLGYNGLGDLFVFVFFGVVAVVGTYYVQAQALHPMAFVLSVHVGVSAVAILVVNNLRDIDTDKAVGKNTLAVKLGRRFTRLQYLLMILTAYLVPLAAVATGYGEPTWLLCLFTVPLAVFLCRDIYRLKGVALNGLLARTAAFQLASGLLLALGVALGSPDRDAQKQETQYKRAEVVHSVCRIMLPVDASTKNWEASSDALLFHGPRFWMNHPSTPELQKSLFSGGAA